MGTDLFLCGIVRGRHIDSDLTRSRFLILSRPSGIIFGSRRVALVATPSCERLTYGNLFMGVNKVLLLSSEDNYF